MNDWDDAIAGKIGAADDPTDRHKLRIRLGTLLRRCGRGNRSADFIAAVARGLDERHLFMYPALDAQIPTNGWLTISRDPVPDQPLLFSKEQDLQEFLSANLHQLPVFRGLEVVKTQHVLINGRRIDLLLFDKSSNAYVVVELKHHEAGDGGASQLIAYMSLLKEQTADAAGRSVRGVLVAGSISREQRAQFATLSAHFDIQLMRYELDIDFEILHPINDSGAPAEATET